MRTDLPSGDGVNSNHFDGGGSIGDSGGISLVVESGRVVVIEFDEWLGAWLGTDFSRITYVMLSVRDKVKIL